MWSDEHLHKARYVSPIKIGYLPNEPSVKYLFKTSYTADNIRSYTTPDYNESEWNFYLLKSRYLNDNYINREWEAATQAAEARGIRTVRLRIGVVLSKDGGALAQMLFPFRMGVGGRLGSGSQYMSCISIDDTVGAILHALATESLRGAVNAVAPAPVTNAEFTKTLGRVLRRPTVFPVPAFAVRLLFGEMGQELLLGSTRVEPSRLIRSGYTFRHAALEDALRAVLHA